MWNLKVFSLLLVGSCSVLFAFGEPVASEETTIQNDAGVTLSTELQPPPLPAAGEHRGIVYLINLFAVKNKTADDPDGKAENALTDDSPEIIGPLASILLVVDDDDDANDDDDGEVTLDDLVKIFMEEDYDAESISSEEKSTEVEADSTITKETKIAEDKPKTPKKVRSKRTLNKCKVCGGGGGGGGGYGRDYDNYYPSGGGGGQSVGVIPVVLVNLGGGGGGGGGRGHRGHNQGGRDRHEHYPNNGGGGGQGYGYNYNNGGYPNSGGNYPSGHNNYPYGGGNNYQGGSGGGSNAQSQASAQASGAGQGWGQSQAQAQAQAQASSGRY